MHVNEKQFKKFILDAKLISEADYNSAEKVAEKEDKNLHDVLLSESMLSEDALRHAQAYVLGIPFVNLKGQKIDFEILSLIPEPIARNNNIIAFRKKDEGLEVAMLNTDDLVAIEFVKKKVGLKILPRITDTESIKHALLQYQKTLKDEFGDIIKRESEQLKVVSTDGTEGEVSAGDLKKLAEDLPVVRIVDALLKHAIIQEASDIHIEPMENQVLVRYRIDGILHDAMTLPKSTSASITARIKVLTSLKLDEKRLAQDGRFKMELNNQRVSFRVSILPVYFGEKTVMRLLREGGGGFTLDSLGFHGDALERIHIATRKKTGLILVTGPTGSGKSTSLYTILDILNTPGVNISTVEDPIEYQMARVNQTQVKPDIGFTFAEGLRALVRQDPDIIMVGEIRDTETASLAVNAALTGHLVLSTVHTNSAAGAIPRLLDMGAEPFLLVSTIEVVIGQRLVRKLCGQKDKYNLSEVELKELKEKVNMDRVMEALINEGVLKKGESWDKVTFYKPRKSTECEDGYHGRIGIHEVLLMTPSIQDMITKGETTEKISEQAQKEGMMSMIEDGVFLAVQGITTIEEVLRVISE